MEVAAIDPAIENAVIYKDIRSPGHMEYFFLAAQKAAAGMMTRGDVERVEVNGKLSIHVTNSMLGDNVAIDADLVVLAVGMVPNSADGELIRELIDSRHQAEHSESSQVREKSGQTRRRAGLARGHRDPPPRLPPGPRSADPQVRFPGLALHLLPLRDPPHRRLRRRRRPRAHGLRPGLRGRVRRRHEGGPVYRDGQARRGRVTLGPATPPSRTSSCSAARSASAAPRNAPSGRSTKTPRERPSSSPSAAVVAVSAWAPARSGSSASRTTRST